MNKYGLIGNNISYSKSPILHKIISEVYNLNFSYELLDINSNELDDILSANLNGFNITKPYKETLLNKVSNHTSIVSNVKAANTLFKINNVLYLDNTDYYGFKYLVKYYKIDINNKSIAILGTGGAAKVCFYYLNKYTKNIKYVSRSISNSETITYDEYNNYQFDIIVNATPIGTYPNINESPLTKSEVNNSLVIDLIYNPKETLLMSYSNNSYNGLIMLVVQALYSHKRWNNIKVTKDKILKIKEKLENV